jgi:hypothetical protein
MVNNSTNNNYRSSIDSCSDDDADRGGISLISPRARSTNQQQQQQHQVVDQQQRDVAGADTDTVRAVADYYKRGRSQADEIQHQLQLQHQVVDPHGEDSEIVLSPLSLSLPQRTALLRRSTVDSVSSLSSWQSVVINTNKSDHCGGGGGGGGGRASGSNNSENNGNDDNENDNDNGDDEVAIHFNSEIYSMRRKLTGGSTMEALFNPLTSPALYNTASSTSNSVGSGSQHSGQPNDDELLETVSIDLNDEDDDDDREERKESEEATSDDAHTTNNNNKQQHRQQGKQQKQHRRTHNNNADNENTEKNQGQSAAIPKRSSSSFSATDLFSQCLKRRSFQEVPQPSDGDHHEHDDGSGNKGGNGGVNSRIAADLARNPLASLSDSRRHTWSTNSGTAGTGSGNGSGSGGRGLFFSGYGNISTSGQHNPNNNGKVGDNGNHSNNYVTDYSSGNSGVGHSGNSSSGSGSGNSSSDSSPESREEACVRVSVTLFLWCSTVLLALVFTDLGIVLSFTGTHCSRQTCTNPVVKYLSLSIDACSNLLSAGGLIPRCQAATFSTVCVLLLLTVFSNITYITYHNPYIRCGGGVDAGLHITRGLLLQSL